MWQVTVYSGHVNLHVCVCVYVCETLVKNQGIINAAIPALNFIPVLACWSSSHSFN